MSHLFRCSPAQRRRKHTSDVRAVRVRVRASVRDYVRIGCPLVINLSSIAADVLRRTTSLTHSSSSSSRVYQASRIDRLPNENYIVNAVLLLSIRLC